MAQQTVEIVGNYNDPASVVQMCEVFCSVLQNAVVGYKLVVDRIQTTANGRLRVTLSAPMPQSEIDSFLGAIIVV
jgi:hypothetical protein